MRRFVVALGWLVSVPVAAATFTVPCPSAYAAWIQQIWAEQITSGCGGGNYCPLNLNTRGQMAVSWSRRSGFPDVDRARGLGKEAS